MKILHTFDWHIGRIYLDFICAVRQADGGNAKLVVLEMKGEYLEGDRDTEYKRAVMQLMSENFALETQSVGTLELATANGDNGHCDLMLFQDWENRLPALL